MTFILDGLLVFLGVLLKRIDQLISYEYANQSEVIFH